jgi:chromosomal replication initiation ATPase DnaA
MTPAQLALDLPHREALGREDFLVASSNAAAVALIDEWPDWPAAGALLVGPAGSGKSHLVEVWRQRTGAGRVSAATLAAEDIPQLLEGGALAVEDAGQGPMDERAFFHLLNLARQSRASVLLTARTDPQAWNIGLADLASRLGGLPLIRIAAADDNLLRAVLVKLFADRQLALDEAAIGLMLSRMPRSLEAARALVAEVDRRALEEKAEVTRAFIARVLKAQESSNRS